MQNLRGCRLSLQSTNGRHSFYAGLLCLDIRRLYLEAYLYAYYTPGVAAVIAADKIAAEHKAEADKIVTMPSNTMPATTTERNLDIVRDILTIAGLEGVRGRTDIVTVPGLKGRLSTHIMKYKAVPHQWMSANTHLRKNSDAWGKIRKILGVAVSLSKFESWTQTADTRFIQDTYAWLFGDYTWKHTYTPAVAAFIAADKFAAEHKAEADKIAAGGGGGVTDRKSKEGTQRGVYCQVP